MKTKTYLMIAIFAIFGISSLNAQKCCSSKKSKDAQCKEAKIETTSTNKAKTEKEASFKVLGNCGMCKTRIESAAKSIEGIQTAEWNYEDKMLKLTYNDGTDIYKVHQAIAKVGHDTEMHKADNKVYASLPGCCKYERKELN